MARLGRYIQVNFIPDLITFPQKNHPDNNVNEYCSICYTYRISGQIPIVSCDNDKCSLIFHSICLKEWFATLRDTKTFLNLTSGRCPMCKEVRNTFHWNSNEFNFWIFYTETFIGVQGFARRGIMSYDSAKNRFLINFF